MISNRYVLYGVFVGTLSFLLAACGGGDSPPGRDASLDGDTTVVDASADADGTPDGNSSCPPGTHPDGEGGCTSDPCVPDPCVDLPMSRCREDAGEAVCECIPGHHEEGGVCVTDTSCTDTTCNGHGECVEEDDRILCDCEEGYEGEFCHECAEGWFDDGLGGCTTDPCDPNPCDDPTRSWCEIEEGVPVCRCNAGTHDEMGECIPDTSCTDETCAGHGTCADDSGTVRCECNEGYAPPFCEDCDEAGGFHDDGLGGCTTDPCLPNPCELPHRGECVADGLDLRCDCDPGYHPAGDECLIDEVCDAESCGARGDCEIVDGQIRCTCDEGFVGLDCDSCDETNGWHDDGLGGCTTDACVPNPCETPGRTVCEVEDGAPSCHCEPGFHEDGVGGCTDDPCVPNPCVGVGQVCRVVDGTADCYTPLCTDSNPCTTDDFVGGECVFEPLVNGTSCSTTLCVSGQSCTDGVCTGGASMSCDDGDGCTRDSCDDLDGCHHVNDESLVPDDGFECTTDSCSGGIESHIAADGLCDDGLYCTGHELCLPGDADVNARGCIAIDVPEPPNRFTSPCRYYEPCRESEPHFEMIELAPGSTCDDSVACTTGDQCEVGGTCRGTAIPDCPPQACTRTATLSDAIDVPIARVTGRITQGGADLPNYGSYYDEAVLYLVAHDTGAWHHLGSVDYRYDSAEGTDTLYSDAFDSQIVPGVYDLLYRLSWDRDFDTVTRTDVSDAHINGLRILEEDVVIGLGSHVLDVDIPLGAVSGRITQGGADLPNYGSYYDEAALYLVARDTGAWHHLGSVDYRYDSAEGTDTLYSDTFDSQIIPGVYDLLYRLSWDRDFDTVTRTDVSDGHINGLRILEEGVVITEGSQILDVDVPVGNVSGRITQGGAELPYYGSYYDEAALYLVARDTGAWHHLGSVDYRYDAGEGTDTLYSDTFDSLIVPGVYDLLYRLSWDRDFDTVTRTDADDEHINGLRILEEGVVITEGSQTFDVDVPIGNVSGRITQGGADLPYYGSYYDEAALYLVARDTGAWHHLGSVDYRYDSDEGTDTLYSDAFDSQIIPGVYDLLYRLSWDRDFDTVTRTDVDDEHINGLRILEEGVVITEGSQTLDVDVPVGNVSGRITQGGAELPYYGSYYDEAALYLVARDTGAWHHLGSVDYRYDSAEGTDTLYSDVFDSQIIPGVYDLLYRLSWDRDFDTVARTDVDDEHINGLRILEEGVEITEGSQILDVDVPVGNVSGRITQGGADLPYYGSYYDEAALYLVARDTGAWHHLGGVDYRYDSAEGTDTLYSDAFDSQIIPGVYDLLYRLSWDRDFDTVTRTDVDDEHINGLRYLGHCVEIR